MAAPTASELLGRQEPAPVIVTNPGGASRFLLLGDHAGTAIPAKLGTLGLSAIDLERHIACDLGVRGLGEALAERLDALFLHQAYSRLVIDCNRHPASAEAIPERSDGTVIKANLGLDRLSRTMRISAIHEPYQIAIAAAITHLAQDGVAAVLVSLHSFTPRLGGVERPWHAGVLHDGGNDRFAAHVLARLRRHPHLVIGDNAPYRMDATDHTVPRHAFGANLAYVELEIRQDLLADAAAQRSWSELIAEALSSAVGTPALEGPSPATRS